MHTSINKLSRSHDSLFGTFQSCLLAYREFRLRNHAGNRCPSGRSRHGWQRLAGPGHRRAGARRHRDRTLGAIARAAAGGSRSTRSSGAGGPISSGHGAIVGADCARRRGGLAAVRGSST